MNQRSSSTWRPKTAPSHTYMTSGKDKQVSLSSMDSDLEAFSHHPTDGSVGPLAFQPRPHTNDPSQRFLSYLIELLLQHQDYCSSVG
jgi:hypothetical protein